MTFHPGLPVAGYAPQSQERIDLVNTSKHVEELVLRMLDDLRRVGDPRWLSIARAHIELGFMAANRGIFQPARVHLPDDRRGDAPSP